MKTISTVKGRRTGLQKSSEDRSELSDLHRISRLDAVRMRLNKEYELVPSDPVQIERLLESLLQRKSEKE